MKQRTSSFFTGYERELDWRTLTILPSASLREAIQRIDDGASQILLVVDEDMHLLGTITDGDIRRGILRGLDLDESCDGVMKRNPISFPQGTARAELLHTMRERVVQHLPIVDGEGRLVDMATLNHMLSSVQMDHPVVIMAGGYGKRLGDLTSDCPKPMLQVGGKPILETILGNFIDQGFYRFYLSVNYLADQIKSYFGNGAKWGVQIHYIEEKEPLGTAGALHMVDQREHLPMVVMNGDLLTKVNFQHLLRFHEESEASATMCVREFDMQVPYGVVEVDAEHRLSQIVEKPKHKFFVNAGVYVLAQEARNVIPENAFYNMTTLFEDLMAQKRCVSTFPIHEYWRDIGQLPDYQTAHAEYQDIFS